MKDKYKNFLDLKTHRPKSFIISKKSSNNNFLIFTPHGGGIEPGTTEICKWFGEQSFSYYSLTGKGSKCNELHITSTRFDEPSLLKMLRLHLHSISFHGMSDSMKRKYNADIFLGGLNIELRNTLKKELKNKKYSVATSMEYPKSKLAALNNKNITNKCANRGGVQIELSESLRGSFFSGNYKLQKGRRITTNNFSDFCALVKEVVNSYQRENES